MSLILTQTSVKDLEREDSCPLKWKAQWIDRNPALKIKSDDLDRGKYFEYLVIGAGAIDGEDVKDLPRLASGAKSVDQIRIEEQAELVKRALYDKTYKDFLGFNIVSTQLYINDSKQGGTLDIEAIEIATNEAWIIDLKLTKDLSSDRTKYGWGNDWADMDLIQLAHYQDLYEKTHKGVTPKVGILVADYSPKRQIEFGEIIISDAKRAEKAKRFERAAWCINMYNDREWATWGSYKECKNCPLVCSDRVTDPKIVKKIVNY